jgi:hypothetical protein
MNSNVRMPGFTAAIVLEPTTRHNHYVGVQRRLSDQQVVVPQGEFLCGLAIAALVGGIAFGSPFAIIGAIGGISSQCR